MKSNISSSIEMSMIALASLGLSACASQQGPRPVASAYGASSDTEVVASGPVADSDAAMKQRPGTVQTHQVAKATSRTKDEETQSESTETTTVVGSSAVAAPDSEVKFSNQ
jgi:hypothetical protein